MEKFKKIKIKHFKDCINLFDKEWDLGKSHSLSTGKICALIYLFEVIRYSDLLIGYFDNNKLIGFAGFGNYKKPKNKIKKRFYNFLYHLSFYNPKIKDKAKLKKYYDALDYLPSNLENYFDGELSMLIVDSNYRGKKIGLELFNKICLLAKENGMENMRIDSDESCSFSFYEKTGCIKKYDEMRPSLEYNGKLIHTFVFEKKL